jgi:hypothetical protein
MKTNQGRLSKKYRFPKILQGVLGKEKMKALNGLAVGFGFMIGLLSLISGAASASETVVLSILSANSPPSGAADLDLAMLERMPHHSITTTTPWTEGVSVFEGVFVRDLLRAFRLSGATTTFFALNEYQVQIPTSDFEKYDVLLAYKRDGQYMRVRDKGPLWVIYPLDQHPEINNTETHAKMIWQVCRVVVE